MNLIGLLSAPLKKIYGANKSDDPKARPWEMTIQRKSFSYKSMIQIFREEDNIPRFVLHNGCPWAIISTLAMILFPLVFCIVFIFKVADKCADLILIPINKFFNSFGFSKKEVVKEKPTQTFLGYIEKNVNKESIDEWFHYHNKDKNLIYFNDYNKDELEYIHEMWSDKKLPSYYNSWDDLMKDEDFGGYYLVTAMVEAHGVAEAREMIANYKPIPYEDTKLFTKREKDKKVKEERIAKNKKRQARIDKCTLAVVKFWNFIAKPMLYLAVLAILALVGWGGYEIYKVFPAIYNWFSGLDYGQIGGVTAVVVGILLTLAVFFIFAFKCEEHKVGQKIRNLISRIPDKAWMVIFSPLIIVIAPFYYLFLVIKNICTILGMALKSECPVTKIED